MNTISETPSRPAKARIEIVPLIDVVFFLLATFVLFTLSLNRIRSIPTELPRVPIDPLAIVEPLVIQVSGDGALYWEREPLAPGELAGRLAALKHERPDPRVMIAGDDKASFGAAVAVLDEVRRIGIAKVALETRLRRTGQ